MSARWSCDALIPDPTLAAVVAAMARATGAGCRVSVSGEHRTITLVANGETLLRLDAIMSANAPPPGIAGWRVSVPDEERASDVGQVAPAGHAFEPKFNGRCVTCGLLHDRRPVTP